MILNIPYILKLVMAHSKLRQCRINSLISINALSCKYIIKKQKFASFTKIRPSQKNGKMFMVT